MKCVQHPDAPFGRATKYARLERERRFLLKRTPAGPCIRRAEVADLYFIGTRLRLRRTEEIMATSRTVVYKLTQKVPTSERAPGLITTVYLSEAEYALLRGLPGVELRKFRYSVPPLGVDVFVGDLSGLVMAEIEFETAEEQGLFPEPEDSVAEVTLDPRLNGGRLATTSRSEMLGMLEEFGLGPVDVSDLANRHLSPVRSPTSSS
jgi:CYTH domain-containing protein